jgi:homoserine dehydrogenase
MSKKLVLGIFGFGVVGQGLYDIIKTKKLNIEIKKFVIKHGNKKRSIDQSLFSTNPEDILNDNEINTVIELIDDADAAFDIVSKALSSGKNVVSANKKMIANHLEELVELQQKHGTSLLYEGAVCGSIPIIRNLEEYYDNELLHSVSGIFNGSSNYILTKIFQENMPYAVALKQAQDLGFAESDPSLDVGGYDAKYKLAIAAAHAYGIYIDPDEILNIGIANISENDVLFAKEKNLKIKLIPIAQEENDSKVVLYVLPKFISPDNILFNVENEYNGVQVQAAFADQQFFYGKGAGGHPTGSAVLSDIAALRYDYRYEYKKHIKIGNLSYSSDYEVKVYLRYEDESLLNELGFTSLIEKYSGPSFNYVIVKINLQNIQKHRAVLDKGGVFIAEIS